MFEFDFSDVADACKYSWPINMVEHLMVVLTERLSDINSILVFSNSVFREDAFFTKTQQIQCIYRLYSKSGINLTSHIWDFDILNSLMQNVPS